METFLRFNQLWYIRTIYFNIKYIQQIMQATRHWLLGLRGLVFHTLWYSKYCKSLVGKRGKNTIYIKGKYPMPNAYFVIVNQFVMMTVECLYRWLQHLFLITKISRWFLNIYVSLHHMIQPYNHIYKSK